jgi:hypothetical protein
MTMSNIVPFPKNLIDDRDFVVAMARYAEGLISEKQVKKKYRFSDEVWNRLGENDELIEAIEEERLRRQRDGSTKREKAQQHVVKAPDILNTIMSDPAASPKHRIDSAKTLDQFAANGPTGAPATDRFQITIVLSADGGNADTDVIHFDKSIAINPNDDSTPQGLLPAASKDDEQ